MQTSDLNIFPNPSNSSFKIAIPNGAANNVTSKIGISISSIDGKVLKTVSSQMNLTSGNTIEMQRESLPDGLYFVAITVDDKKYFSRITIAN